MTLNSVISRIKTIALAHKQVRSFSCNVLDTDNENEHTKLYPCVNLLLRSGTISVTAGATVFSFDMFVGDLVNVASDAKRNEQDVLSDSLLTAQDIYTLFKNGNYTDWKFNGDISFSFGVELNNDQVAGVDLSFSVNIPYTQNICAVPGDEILIPIDPVMDNTVYNYTYIAKGNEGSIITTAGMGPNAPDLNGKEVLFVGRETNVIVKNNITSLDSIEWGWDYSELELGTVTNPGERFTILYRNRNV